MPIKKYKIILVLIPRSICESNLIPNYLLSNYSDLIAIIHSLIYKLFDSPPGLVGKTVFNTNLFNNIANALPFVDIYVIILVFYLEVNPQNWKLSYRFLFTIIMVAASFILLKVFSPRH